ncbi:hypothetical protein [Hippea sp. KM1]|uniref:hypothetical protein n=1 Tax=Hippea sp. KM1 TaxID=944481 RepID=UPI00046D7C0E|nr:hypothetical protein [Hippea sp. KM1]
MGLFRFFNAVAILGVGLEIALRLLFNYTICHSSGCLLVARHVRFGEIVMLFIGEAFFLILLIVSFVKNEKTKGLLLDAMLIAALACEGFLVGYQLFWIGDICYFCFGVFITIIILSLIRIQQSLRITAGFLSFLALLMMLWMVKPNQQLPILPKEDKILIYSSHCPHCMRLIKTLNLSNLKIKMIEASKLSNILKSLNINEVPVLIEREKDGLSITIGDKPIEEKLNLETKKQSVDIFNTEDLIQQNGSACRLNKPCK